MKRYIPIMAVTKLISVDDFGKLVGKVESERDRIAIRLLFSTGCRVGDVIGSKLEDIDTVKDEIHIYASRTKIRQYQDVVIPEYWRFQRETLAFNKSVHGTHQKLR